ncbi:MAG TPA: hypothetical protein VFL68_10475 [Pseudolabrys sp.]|nr:hypothetical protein [Pseudolabrys sp.]
MPIDLAQVEWLYVILLAVFVAISTYLGSLLSFSRRGTAAMLSAVLFAAIFIFWTYYPHRVPFLPRTLTTMQDAAVKPAPAPVAPAAPQRPSNPVKDITPPKNPVTDVTPPAPASPPATPAR